MPNRCQKAEPQRLKFTDLAVGRLKPGIYWDSLLPTFGVRVGATSRTWIVAVKGSKRKLGRYPAMSLAEARDRARELMAGGPKTADNVSRFSDLTEQFLQHGRTRKGRELTGNTLNQYRRVFDRYAKPLHQRPFAEITRRDIAEQLRKVAATSGAPTASLVRSMLARLWSYGIETGEVEYNVVTGTPGYEIAARSRVLTDAEIAAIWADVSHDENNYDYALILRLCLWLGVRRSEAGGLRWSEITAATDAGVIWTIPGSRTKNHRDLILPLPKQAAAALAQWPRIVGKDTLFGTYSSRGFTSWSESKAALDAQLKFSRPWCLHDLRRTTETRLAGLGVNKEVRSRLLNHDAGPIDESYQHHEFTTEKRDALQLWADKLEEIVTASQPEVIKLNSRLRS